MAPSPKLPYLPLYTQDFFQDSKVVQMRWAEQAIYLRMLIVSWENGPLPDSPVKIGRMIGGACAREDMPAGLDLHEAIKSVLEAAWTRSGASWISTRLEQERERALSLMGVRSAKAKKAAEDRWKGTPCMEQAPSNAPSMPDAMLQASQDIGSRIEDIGDRKKNLDPSDQGQAIAPARPAVLKKRKEPTGPLAEAIRAFEEVYVQARGFPFVFSQKHAVAIQRCLKAAGGDLGEVLRRARVLIETPPNDWYAQNATPAILFSHWNELATIVVADPTAKRKFINEARIQRLENLTHANGNRPALQAPPVRPPELGMDERAG